MKFICLVVLAVSGLSGCASELAPSSFEGTTPEMRPEAFFAGTTSSSGVLHGSVGVPRRRLHVEGFGMMLADGTFQLTQQVTLDDDAPQTRTWVMRRLDSHRYTATLTDASGIVEGEAYGHLFHLRYAMKKPLGGTMEQWLYLQPDGTTVMNEATIRVLGVSVAHLSERIIQEHR